MPFRHASNPRLILPGEAEWEDVYTHLKKTLGMPEDAPTPELPRPSQGSTLTITDHTNGVDDKSSEAKRKAPDADADVDMNGDDSAPSKRPHVDGKANGSANGSPPSAADAAQLHARTTAAYIPFLSTEDLLPPKMPSVQEMEQILLGLRKKALTEEYFGDS